MADDRTKTDNRDRNQVGAGEDYEVSYLMEKAGVSREQAIGLIRRWGNDRETLMKHAQN